MTFFISCRAGSALLSSSIVLAAPAFAQSGDIKTLDPVIVTASRFASDPASVPIGATVISAEEIREAGIGNVSEAVRRLGGVYGRQNPTGTPDASLDLRGFGSTSDQNMVILVDGIRLSEAEQAVALLSSIPIESVERIEIVRGGSSVLYGEGATGGTIQIVTKRGASNALRGSVVGEVGSFGHREARVSASKGWDGFVIDANGSTQRADNYRDNNASRQQNFSGGMKWEGKDGRVGVRVDAARQRSRFAGALTLAQFQGNPRQAATPENFGSYDVDRYTLFGERSFGNVELAAELSHREKTARASYSGSPVRYDGEMTQFSPRVRHLSAHGGLENELIVGLDFFRIERTTDGAFSRADASQKSRALYARDSTKFGKARFAFGARTEKFDKDFVDPLGFSATGYAASHSLNAWDLQGSYAFTPLFELFAKTGKSYRVANVDDNASTPIPNQLLEPQTSRDLELGLTFGAGSEKATLRIFQHRLENEIAYNPLSFANVNLDPTERKGVELELSSRVSSSFLLAANLQHVAAEFRSGPNAGKEMTLVPKNTASLRLNWLPGTRHSAYAGLQWVDEQRYSGDFANACSARIPSHTTLDGRYAYRTGAWEFAVAGTNLTDRDYFSNAYTYGVCQTGIYPDAGRQLKISARYDF